MGENFFYYTLRLWVSDEIRSTVKCTIQFTAAGIIRILGVYSDATQASNGPERKAENVGSTA